MNTQHKHRQKERRYLRAVKRLAELNQLMHESIEQTKAGKPVPEFALLDYTFRIAKAEDIKSRARQAAIASATGGIQ